MADKQKQSGKKGNKRALHGRKKRQCAAYRLANRRERNKARGLLRHLRHQPNDKVARACLDKLRDEYYVVARMLRGGEASA